MKRNGHANVAVFVPHNGCPHQCSFCNQNSITGRSAQPSPEDVQRAAERARETLPTGAQAELAFFGGSFTAVKREYMVSLLEAASPYVKSGLFSGIRISTRPDSVDEEVLRLLKEYGVTSIELGAQSMRDSVLSANGRGHTAQDVNLASERIRKAGFSLGLQMMTGLWRDDAQGARYTAERLAALQPQTMRIYPTVVVRGTELGRLYASGLYHPMELEETVSLCAELLDFFEEKGISVIRLGLHDTPQLEEDRLGGAYHPALRELCESKRLFGRLFSFLAVLAPEGEAEFAVHPRGLSRAVGQKRQNLREFEKAGWKVKFRPDPELAENRAVFLGGKDSSGDPLGGPGTSIQIPGRKPGQEGERNPCG